MMPKRPGPKPRLTDPESVTFNLDGPVLAEIEAIAEANRQHRSEVLREAVLFWLESKKGKRRK